MKLRCPMLAEAIKPEELVKRLPIYGSFKIDGVRATVQRMNGQPRLISRSGIEIASTRLQSVFAVEELIGVDGEFSDGEPYGKELFHRTSGLVRRINDKQSDRIQFNIFDDLEPGKAFERYERYKIKVALFKEKFPQFESRIDAMEQFKLQTMADVKVFADTAVEIGYEGVVFKKIDGWYKHDRSTLNEGLLLKWKVFDDAEAIIIGTVPRYHNANSVKQDAFGSNYRGTDKENIHALEELGAFIVECPKFKKQFQVSGFNLQMRNEYWKHRESLIGKTITFRYQVMGSTPDAPRIPQFKGFREKWDL
jgi:ATP-dependent DNA ligase